MTETLKALAALIVIGALAVGGVVLARQHPNHPLGQEVALLSGLLGVAGVSAVERLWQRQRQQRETLSARR